MFLKWIFPTQRLTRIFLPCPNSVSAICLSLSESVYKGSTRIWPIWTATNKSFKGAGSQQGLAIDLFEPSKSLQEILVPFFERALSGDVILRFGSVGRSKGKKVVCEKTLHGCQIFLVIFSYSDSWTPSIIFDLATPWWAAAPKQGKEKIFKRNKYRNIFHTLNCIDDTSLSTGEAKGQISVSKNLPE